MGKSMSYKTTDLKIIANELRLAKDKGYSTAVLLGSGMSLTAGIPLAIDMIKEIKKKFPILADTCDKETYQAYMSLLTPAQRKELIDPFIESAKINIAHLYLGSLVKENYVDLVLTTNFDPFVIRSLKLYNI